MTSRGQVVDIVPHVANRSHPSGKVEQPVIPADVGVHVPEARDQHLAGPIDNLCAPRLLCRGGTDRLNAVAGDQHILSSDEFSAAGVEDTDILNQ